MHSLFDLVNTCSFCMRYSSSRGSPIAFRANQFHTSDAITANSSHQAINPVGVLLRFPHNGVVTFLENLVDRDQGLERLDLVGENGLPVTSERESAIASPSCFRHSNISKQHIHFHARPESCRRLVVPRVHDTAAHMFPCQNNECQSNRARESTTRHRYFANDNGPRVRTYVSARFPLQQSS